MQVVVLVVQTELSEVGEHRLLASNVVVSSLALLQPLFLFHFLVTCLLSQRWDLHVERPLSRSVETLVTGTWLFHLSQVLHRNVRVVLLGDLQDNVVVGAGLFI